MHLKLGRGADLEDPSEAQIEAALRALPGGLDSFAILARNDQHYIQAAGGPADGFVLEYRDGKEAEHYRSSRTGLSPDEAVAAFLSYRRGDDAYRHSLGWERDEPTASAWAAQGMFALLLVVAAIVLWRVFG